MKTKQEIDELYHKCWDDFSNKYDDNLHYYSFVEGYTQCQQDNEVEMDRLKKIMIESSNQAMTWEEKYWQLKNSLNKQD